MCEIGKSMIMITDIYRCYVASGRGGVEPAFLSAGAHFSYNIFFLLHLKKPTPPTHFQNLYYVPFSTVRSQNQVRIITL